MATVTPRLIVRSVPEAIAYYCEVFGARERHRFAMPNGTVVHAAIEIGDTTVTLAEAVPSWRLHAPDDDGHSPVLMSLACDDPDDLCARAVARGARVLVPIADQFYGRREGRIVDPMGHLWILSKVLEVLDDAEIRRRMS